MPSLDRAADLLPPISRILGLAAALVLLVAAGYHRIAPAFFVGDDYSILAIVAKAGSVREATGIADNWEFFRPLTALTYWANWLLCGPSPLAFHAVDLVLHAANGLLVAGLVWQLLPQGWGAAAAGALFVLHPMHAESVCWIAGRFDQLYTTGVLLCLGGYLAFLRTGSRPALAVSSVGLLVGVLGKDTGLILPVLPAAVALAFRGQPARQRWLGLLPLAVLFGLTLCLRLYVLGGLGGYRAEELSPTHLDLANAAAHVYDAVWLALAPGSTATVRVLSLAALAFALLRHGRLGVFAGCAWPLAVLFLIALAPSANTVQLGAQGENGRFLYAPAAFACAAVGLLLGTARHPHGMVAATVALLCCHGASLSRVTTIWREAGDRAESILQQVKSYTDERPYRYLFVHGLPDTHRGAYVFKNGFERGLALFVDPHIEFPANGRISRADWDTYSAVRREDPAAHPDSLLLRYDPETGRMVTP